MLVILTEEQILAPQKVCCGCLLANKSGLPRWDHGKLGCGRVMRDLGLGGANSEDCAELAELYECQMGFRLANIE